MPGRRVFVAGQRRNSWKSADFAGSAQPMRNSGPRSKGGASSRPPTPRDRFGGGIWGPFKPPLRCATLACSGGAQAVHTSRTIPSASRSSRRAPRRHHPILDATPERLADGTVHSERHGDARAPSSARARRVPLTHATVGWTTLGPALIARGGVATAEELVSELFGLLPSHPDFSKKRKLVYAWKAGRTPVGKPMWDRSALGHALLGPSSPAGAVRAPGTDIGGGR